MSTDRLPEQADVVIVGGGIIGLAVARQLLMDRPGTELVLVEKEDVLAAHQTGHNSGVVHAGLYYRPGSDKAVLCRRGVGYLLEYATARGIPFEECGKLVVALDEEEIPALESIFDRAGGNGVPDVALIDKEGITGIEPHAVGVRAVWSPTTAITDFTAVALALADDVRDLGGVIVTGTMVRDFTRTGNGTIVMTDDGMRLRAGAVVIAAGLHSDRLARKAGDGPGPRIVPFRGEYYRIRPERRYLVRGLIYPVPDPRYPFLGVHFTKTVKGDVLVGPNAILALAREGYRRRDIDLREVAGMLASPGMWKLVSRHWKKGLAELGRSLSRRTYGAGTRRYVPDLRPSDLELAPAGVRAQALDRDGGLVDDFRITKTDGVISIRNAPSPAATSSLAIAERVAEIVPGAQ